MRLGFIKIVVKDLSTMQAFYMQTFSMIVHRRIEDELFTEVILKWPHAGEAPARLILFHHKDARDIVTGTAYGPLGFYVPDIDAVIDEAVALGATLIQPAADVPLFRIAFLNDPEGHELELIEPQAAGR